MPVGMPLPMSCLSCAASSPDLEDDAALRCPVGGSTGVRAGPWSAARLDRPRCESPRRGDSEIDAGLHEHRPADAGSCSGAGIGSGWVGRGIRHVR